MTNREAEQGAPENPDQERLVCDFLLRDPGFFERHPDLLLALQIPHATGCAISLIEYQVRVLRRQLDAEHSRLTHLISRAREYEALADRLHGLVLELISVKDPDHLCLLIREAMLKEFHAEAVSIKLFALQRSADDDPDPLTAAFRDFVDREHTLCGPLSEQKAIMLFGDAGAGIQAAALVPIHSEGRSGVLAIGSTDPERFHPDMGTDFLDRLGEIVSRKLRALPLGLCSQP